MTQPWPLVRSLQSVPVVGGQIGKTHPWVHPRMRRPSQAGNQRREQRARQRVLPVLAFAVAIDGIRFTVGHPGSQSAVGAHDKQVGHSKIRCCCSVCHARSASARLILGQMSRSGRPSVTKRARLRVRLEH